MFYFLYQTTNLLNGKIYVGVHKTNNLDDDYLGTGTLIKQAIKKYGKQNFKRVILEMFDTADSMYLRESQVVTKAFTDREDVYNIRVGGKA